MSLALARQSMWPRTLSMFSRHPSTVWSSSTCVTAHRLPICRSQATVRSRYSSLTVINSSSLFTWSASRLTFASMTWLMWFLAALQKTLQKLSKRLQLVVPKSTPVLCGDRSTRQSMLAQRAVSSRSSMLALVWFLRIPKSTRARFTEWLCLTISLCYSLAQEMVLPSYFTQKPLRKSASIPLEDVLAEQLPSVHYTILISGKSSTFSWAVVKMLVMLLWQTKELVASKFV